MLTEESEDFYKEFPRRLSDNTIAGIREAMENALRKAGIEVAWKYFGEQVIPALWQGNSVVFESLPFDSAEYDSIVIAPTLTEINAYGEEAGCFKAPHEWSKQQVYFEFVIHKIKQEPVKIAFDTTIIDGVLDPENIKIARVIPRNPNVRTYRSKKKR